MSDSNLSFGASPSSPINRRTLLKAGAAASAGALASGTLAAGKERRPNILFIVADDLGYADLSCFGRRDYETPAIDALARQGLRFTSAYANSPVCSATRTGLITGRYHHSMHMRLARLSSPPVAFPKLPDSCASCGFRRWNVRKPPDSWVFNGRTPHHSSHLFRRLQTGCGGTHRMPWSL